MGRIIAQIQIKNICSPQHTMQASTLVDTGAAYLVLPSAWRDRLGDFPMTRQAVLELGNQQRVSGQVVGPASIQIEGFPAISGEILFVDMSSQGSAFEPLLGYLPLEACQAGVDMVGHRLIDIKKADLK